MSYREVPSAYHDMCRIQREADLFLFQIIIAELQLVVTHRYESGVKQAVIDSENRFIVSLAHNKNVAVHYLRRLKERRDLCHTTPDLSLFEKATNTISIISQSDSELVVIILENYEI